MATLLRPRWVRMVGVAVLAVLVLSGCEGRAAREKVREMIRQGRVEYELNEARWRRLTILNEKGNLNMKELLEAAGLINRIQADFGSDEEDDPIGKLGVTGLDSYTRKTALEPYAIRRLEELTLKRKLVRKEMDEARTLLRELDRDYGGIGLTVITIEDGRTVVDSPK